MTVIGLMYPEEAKVFDCDAGVHHYTDKAGNPLPFVFEVFWHDGGHMIDQPEDDDMPLDDWREPESAGWYFRVGDGDDATVNGPYSYSWQAKERALEIGI